MTDIQKLKALAEAAPTGPWYPPDETSHKGMVFDCDLGSLLRYESIDTERDACVAYVAAANPAAVLELIAEIERLREEIALDNKIIADRDRLLDLFECPDHGQCIPYAMEQVDALRKDAERYRFVRNPIARGSSLAIWHEGRLPMFSGLADAAIDSDMRKEASQ